MPGNLLLWWSVLCAAAVINLLAWGASAWLFARRAADSTPEVHRARRRVLGLSAVYVLGCGFRSLLPMIDVPRMCLHDTLLSYIAVGRSVATLAELCFAAQWAIVLREAGASAGSALATRVARLLVPLIAVAEIFSWSAVLTTNNFMHAAENSLWTLAAVLAVASFASLRVRLGERHERILLAAIVPPHRGVVDLAVNLHRDLLVAFAHRGCLKIGNALLEIGAAIAAEIGRLGRFGNEDRRSHYASQGSDRH